MIRYPALILSPRWAASCRGMRVCSSMRRWLTRGCSGEWCAAERHEHPGTAGRVCRGCGVVHLRHADIREAAREDAREFVAEAVPMIIDEIQRLPELILSIKARVDERPVPGQFLLTGSARVLGLRTLPDALPGRMETIELWPFAQGEIDGRPDRFIDAVFRHAPDLRHVSSLERADYADRVVRGGFPEAVARDQPRRRQRFFDSYVSNLISRDVSQVGEMEKLVG